MTDWWVTRRGGEPVGPADEEAVVRGIRALKVPVDSLVCEVGGSEWLPIDQVPAFATAFRLTDPLQRFDDGEERTIVDALGLSPDDGDDEDRTTLDRMQKPPRVPSEEPLGAYDTGEEKTTVDPGPSRSGA